MSTIIRPEQVKPGDILLFVSEDQPKPDGFWNRVKWHFFSKIARKIKEETNSPYTHAAICYDAGILAHAPKPRAPIEMIGVRDILTSCKYAAVFRSSWAFRGDRVNKLQVFLNRIIEEGATYNTWGIYSFAARKESHFRTLKERLEAHFNGQGTQESFDKMSYFCSELVGACLCVIGAIEPSAAVVFHPSTVAPADLGRDPTWGTFLGYLVPSDDIEIPKNDEFYHNEPLPKDMGGI